MKTIRLQTVDFSRANAVAVVSDASATATDEIKPLTPRELLALVKLYGISEADGYTDPELPYSAYLKLLNESMNYDADPPADYDRRVIGVSRDAVLEPLLKVVYCLVVVLLGIVGGYVITDVLTHLIGVL